MQTWQDKAKVTITTTNTNNNIHEFARNAVVDSQHISKPLQHRQYQHPVCVQLPTKHNATNQPKISNRMSNRTHNPNTITKMTARIDTYTNKHKHTNKHKRTKQQCSLRGLWPNHSQPPHCVRAQWQHIACVLIQTHTLLRRLQRQRNMCGTFHIFRAAGYIILWVERRRQACPAPYARHTGDEGPYSPSLPMPLVIDRLCSALIAETPPPS